MCVGERDTLESESYCDYERESVRERETMRVRECVWERESVCRWESVGQRE